MANDIHVFYTPPASYDKICTEGKSLLIDRQNCICDFIDFPSHMHLTVYVLKKSSYSSSIKICFKISDIVVIGAPSVDFLVKCI